MKSCQRPKTTVTVKEKGGGIECNSLDWWLMVGTVVTVLMATDFSGNDWMPDSPRLGETSFFFLLECFVINLAPDFHDNRPCCWNKASVIHFLREKIFSLCLFSYLHRKHHDIPEQTRNISCDQAIFEKQFSTTCLSQSWRTYLISSYYIGFFFFFFTVREVVATAQGLDAHHWPLAWQ